MTVTHNTWSNLNWAEVFRQGLLLLRGMTESASGVSQNQGCSDVEWYMGKPRNTSASLHIWFWINFWSLCIRHCKPSTVVRLFSLHDCSWAMTSASGPWSAQHGSLETINRGGEDWFFFLFFSLFWNLYCFTHLSSLCLERHHCGFQDFLLHTEGTSTEMAYRFSVYAMQ